MIPKLDLPPDSALPNSYFWTWDHSANWVLDDPGALAFGCNNKYMKRPETYVEDYRRLTDTTANLGIKGIAIYGFLRDSHGGIASAKTVADYAASKGVSILPGVGTMCWYGGMYYEGEHRYNIDCFLRDHPDAHMLDEQGRPAPTGLCPSHPAYVDWLQSGMRWLLDEFNIGGVNLENGDLLVCQCPRCASRAKDWPAGDADIFRSQAFSYEPAVAALDARTLREKLITYATYKGFVPGLPRDVKPRQVNQYMECEYPAMIDRLPDDAIAQWTVTHMVAPRPAPLTVYLDNGAAAASDPSLWPAGLKPPGKRTTGFLHHSSQWVTFGTRYDQMVAAIKHTCMMAHRCGMEGVSIHGEVTDRHPAWALNYLAFAHFTRRPEDSLRQFGRATVSQVLGGKADDGEAFVEILAHIDAAPATEQHRKTTATQRKDLERRVGAGDRAALTPCHLWRWLDMLAHSVAPPSISPFL